MATDAKIYIYFHICTLGDWRNIVINLYNHIRDSGLLDVVEAIKVVGVGPHTNELFKLNLPKLDIIYTQSDPKIYERKCLLLLREHAEKERFKVMYIHSKGVSRGSIKGVQDWIKMLIYYNITCHKVCIQALDTSDTCGVNLNGVKVGRPHYSGNFWWANSEYIKTLPKTIGPEYLDPEMWIGKGSKRKMTSLWQSGVDHYRSTYPPEKYLGKVNVQVNELV